MWVMVSFGVAFGIYSAQPAIGLGVTLVVSSFWFGFALLVVSDSIDNGPIDERGWISQTFNVTGILIVALSAIAGVTLMGLLIAIVVPNAGFEIFNGFAEEP